jgi:ketosteroid isomerase-like protein
MPAHTHFGPDYYRHRLQYTVWLNDPHFHNDNTSLMTFLDGKFVQKREYTKRTQTAESEKGEMTE